MNTKIGRIQEVDLRSVWPHEALSFTPWLEENPQELGELLGLDLDLSKEHPIGSFSLDLVGTDLASGRSVIIENQLEKSNHSHLGQLLTYAGGVRPQIVVWVAKQIREEHRAALNWLNSVTDNETHFFGVEVRAIKIGDSLPAPMLDLVVEPNVWGKQVRESASKASRSDRLNAYGEFWESLIAELGDEYPDLRERTAWARSYFPTFTGFADLSLNLVFSGKGLRVELYFGSRDPEKSAKRFDAVNEVQSQLQQLTTSKLVFEPLEGKIASRISIYGSVADVEDRGAWQTYRNWFAKEYAELRKVVSSPVFKSAIKTVG
ncbi:DUF4268 domain-containing protein [Aquiluna sp. KACHI24]|uniref:DUF4268 domain-containing protein n=1 Tax=Aquiluna sp. KACHI24 TaxID=2968831 RepID=UPI00220505D6|nr:DUF4268 domain-containing protein [Aquiluna sp. KACHI24]BDQ00732.1 hypothetical protein AKACHI_10680 [Aquiluna sp. KACHI24]